MDTEEETQEVEGVVQLPSENDDGTLLGEIREKRDNKQPFGKTKVIEVPGYDGKLAVQFRYIDSEETETIGKRIAKELRNVKGRKGATLLASLDTLIAACDRLMIRGSTDEEWRPLKPDPVVFDNTLRPGAALVSDVIGYEARNPRMSVLGLYGEEHGIINIYMTLSRWLADTSREDDEDFLEM